MPDKAPELYNISRNETRIVSVDMRGKLDGSEVCSGTPTVTEKGNSPQELVLSDKAVSTTELTIKGETVPIGQAIQFKIDASGGVLDKLYEILVVCGTDSGQTVDIICQAVVN